MNAINIFRSIILCLIAMVATSCFNKKPSNEYTVKLENKVINTDSKFTGATMVFVKDVTSEAITIVKGMPENENPFAIKKLVVNPFQQAYEKYLNGEISEERYMKFLSSYKVDTLSMKSNFVAPNDIYIYTALNYASRHKYLIVDANCNLDFSDDNLYTFSLDSYDLDIRDSISEKQRVLFQIPITRAGEKDTLSIRIDSFESYNSPDDGDAFYLDLVGITQYYKQGKFMFMDKEFTVNANYFNGTMLPGDLPVDASICLFQSTETIFPTFYKIGDTLILMDRKITIRKGGNDTLFMQDLGALKDDSKVGAILPRVNAMDIENNNPVNINELIENKYALIDFWGSWCGPCIQAMSKLKELSESLHNRKDVIILGITSERNNSAEKAKEIIKEKELPWLNLWVFMDMKRSTSLSFILDLLKVDGFPTYIIIDRAGKIIWRSDTLPSDKNSTDEAISFFKKIIAEDNTTN